MFDLRFNTVSLWVGLICAVVFGCAERKQLPPTIAIPSAVAVPNEAVVPAESAPNAPESVNEPTQTLLVETEPVASETESKTPSIIPAANTEAPIATTDTSEKTPTTITRTQTTPFPEAAFFQDDIVGLMVFHPKQFVASPVGQLLTSIPETQREELFPIIKINCKFEEIERVVLIIDKETINEIAEGVGLDVLEDEDDDDDNGHGHGHNAAAPEDEERQQPVQVKSSIGPDDDREEEAEAHTEVPAAEEATPIDPKSALAQIGLSFLNYHEAFGRFPRADGNGTGEHNGLSWRVHLLPFLDEAPLYNQFHFDEPWDSEHNRTLISQMPDIYRSQDVTDKDKTSFHVFIGEKTPFHGDKGLCLLEIPDGSSNTILVVQAGADTAEIWTKPGGLEVDLASPKKALGTIKGDKILAIFADGIVGTLSAEIDETTLANLIQPADGNVIKNESIQREATPVTVQDTWPHVLISLNTDVNQEEIVKALLSNSSEETHLGQTFRKDQLNALWFASPKTVVAGTIAAVKRAIAVKSSGKESQSPLIGRLKIGADVSCAIDLKSQSHLVQQFVQFSPAMQMLINIETISVEASVSAKDGDPMLEMNLDAADRQTAMQITAMAMMFLNTGKTNLSQMPPATKKGEQEIQDFFKQLANSIRITNEAKAFQIQISNPGGIEKLLRRFIRD